MKKRCYHCDHLIPEGQSFFEGHGFLVCIRCLPKYPRCPQCRFPSSQLRKDTQSGIRCEFCRKLRPGSLTRCHACHQPIPEDSPYYFGHGRKVCKPCTKDSPQCFLCRFPERVEQVPGLGPLCGFCEPKALNKDSDLESALDPLKKYLSQFGHEPTVHPQLVWLDWNVLLGMQIRETSTPFAIRFIDEYLHYAYPLYHLKRRIYVIPRIHSPLFMVHMASQLAAANICERFQVSHLLAENTPFHRLARGWCHWIGLRTAEVLKYEAETKQLKRWPENHLPGDFSKFLGMSEFRKPLELRTYAHTQMESLALKCL